MAWDVGTVDGVSSGRGSYGDAVEKVGASVGSTAEEVGLDSDADPND